MESWKDPRVSIIVPFHNAERFLEEAIGSVLSQTFEDWELLLVDDGSRDRSREIARSAVARLPERARYFTHPGNVNRGLPASRNLGIAWARGTYVALLDSDDVWLPTKLAEQVEMLDGHPEAELMMGPSLYWHSWSGRAEDAHRDSVPDLLGEYGLADDTVLPPPELALTAYPLGVASAPAPSSLLIRKRLFARVGGFDESFTGRLQAYEDQTFLMKAYLHAPVLLSGTCRDRYRQHEDSLSSRFGGPEHYGAVRLHYLRWLGGYLAGIGLRDEAVWSAHRRALESCPPLEVAREG